MALSVEQLMAAKGGGPLSEVSERSLASEKDPILELLPHKLNDVNKYRRVRLEDFNVELLMAAAREGRLYVDESKQKVSRDHIKKEVRAYVARIRRFVTKGFSSSVDDIWEHILSTEEFVVFLTPCSKAKKCREFDKYNVMRIIGVLREKGVYEDFNDTKYNNILEQTDKDTPYRKYLRMGLEQHHLLVKLRQIVAKYQL